MSCCAATQAARAALGLVRVGRGSKRGGCEPGSRPAPSEGARVGACPLQALPHWTATAAHAPSAAAFGPRAPSQTPICPNVHDQLLATHARTYTTCICKHMHAHTRTYAQTSKRMHTRTPVRTHTHAHTHTHMHTHTNTHTHAHTHAHTRTHARTHARKHAQTHTHARITQASWRPAAATL